jgi:Flp pilus assembly protein TadB
MARARILAAVSGAAVLVVLGLSAGSLALAGAATGTALAMGRAGARAAGAASRADELRDAPLFLDVLAAVLRAGAPVAVALERATPLAPAASAQAVREVAGLVRLGAAPSEAWQPLHGTVLDHLARIGTRSSDSGVRVAEQSAALAREMREGAASRADAAARRAGVWAMAPLGLCFLPAFFCLGVLPVILGLGREILGGPAP